MNFPMDSKRSRIGWFSSLNALNPLGILVAGFTGSRRDFGLRGNLTPALSRWERAGARENAAFARQADQNLRVNPRSFRRADSKTELQDG